MNFRLIIISVACFMAGLEWSRSAGAELSVKLTGVAVFGTGPVAIFEIPDRSSRYLQKPILSEGERIGSFEVLSIDVATGRVRVRHEGVETFYAVDTTAAPLERRTLHLQSANYIQVLDIYQRLACRTVIRSENLPGVKVTLSTEDVPAAQALGALDQAFARQGIALRPVGNKFTIAVRTNDLDRLAFIPPPPEGGKAANSDPKGDEILPAGMVKFQDADLSQMLEIYQELSGRTVLKPSDLRSAKVSVCTQTELTRDEVLWVMETIIRLANIAVVPQGEKFVFVVPNMEKPRLPVFEVNEVPANVRAKSSLPPGMLKFSNGDTAQVLAVYAALLGREPQLPAPVAKLSIKSQSELTCPEALYGLEALAALNNVKFELVGERQVRAIPSAQPRHQSKPGLQ